MGVIFSISGIEQIDCANQGYTSLMDCSQLSNSTFFGVKSVNLQQNIQNFPINVPFQSFTTLEEINLEGNLVEKGKLLKI